MSRTDAQGIIPNCRPCPFCGQARVFLVVDIGCHEDDENRYRARCAQCNAMGPDADDRRTATESWNQVRP